MLTILLLAQLAPPASAARPEIVTPAGAARFDLAKYRPRKAGCGDTYPLGDEVLVCARMADDPGNLAALAEIFEPKPFRPAWRMLGGEGGVALEQRGTAMGSAPAAMATFKLKF